MKYYSVVLVQKLKSSALITLSLMLSAITNVSANSKVFTYDLPIFLVDITAPTISNQSFSYAENQNSNYAIGTVLASDDVGVTSYSFTSGNGAGYFAINSSTGLITLTSVGAGAVASNDFETTPNSFTLGVKVSDAALNTATSSITINVINVYEYISFGPDIDGEAAYDYSGDSVALSSDGIIVAIGATENNGEAGSNTGHVRIYKREIVSGTVTWTLLGGDIDGDTANDYLGTSVALSFDGSIVAVGAPKYDGVDKINSGQVKIFKNELISGTVTWTQLGGDIVGEAANDYSGTSVALSSDGSIVAIGAYLGDGVGKSDSGYVRIYKKESLSGTVTWTQLGGAIVGKASGDQSGKSVSLSSDGSIVAIGAPYNDGVGKSDSGHVRIYKREIVSGTVTWTQLGDDINGEASSDHSGTSVSLSSDGSIVAIGAPYNDGGGKSDSGHVRVYQYNGSKWDPIGIDIDGEMKTNLSGTSVSLSSDGSIVAIGARYNNGVTGIRSGHVRIYKNINGTWKQKGKDLDGEAAADQSGTSVALSFDGSKVAIGAPYNRGVNGTSSGHVRVYEFPIVIPDVTLSNESINENNNINAVVGNLYTTDAYSDEIHTYSLVSGLGGDDNGSFTISGTQLLAASVFNYEMQDSYSIRIQTEDSIEFNTFSKSFTISINNLDETAPTISNQIFSYAENQSSGYTIGTVSASDNVGVTTYSFTSGNEDGYFEINSSTGIITLTVKGTGAVASNDFETGTNTFTIVVQVSDAATNTSTSTLTIGVTDLDEAAPTISNQTFSYIENQATGYSIGTVSASDDFGVTSYSFTSGNEDGYFAINSSTGSITLTSTGAGAVASNDFETTPNSFALGVMVSDAASNTATTSVSISVTNAYEYISIGSDINGKAAYDQSGTSVSLSSDGSIVAIGTPLGDGVGKINSGYVRIYKREIVSSAVTWTQLGGDIYGKATNDQSGTSVSLSSDGTIVAIGAPYNGGNGSGYVRIYKREIVSGTVTWTQLGRDINGESYKDRSGTSVALSSDGTTVAIGAPYNKGEGKDETGHVRIYKREIVSGTVTWTQLGKDIDGKKLYDHTGTSVALSSDGTIVAIGAPYNEGVGKIFSGQVRIFKREIVSGTVTWTQLGGDFNGEASNDRSGTSVSLSSDGSIVAIGAPYNGGSGLYSGHVRIFNREIVSGTVTWTQLGGDINGEKKNDRSGTSVSLSSDGSIVAIGAPLNDGSGLDSGHVRIFKKEIVSGTVTWTQLVGDIDGEAAEDHSGNTVSLSSDGSILAIGAPLNDGSGLDSGHVRVFEIPLAPTDIALSSESIDENISINAVVGNLSTVDANSDGTYTYSLVSGLGDTDNGSFTISGTQLLSNEVYDYDTQASYSIRIQTEDSVEFFTFTKSFTITINELAKDIDGDEIIDTIDNCPTTPNVDQKDTDGDGIGDVCDIDDDNDGWNDTIEIACGSNPLSADSKPLDTDGDGIANCQDPDMDNDGCLNADDALPLDATECSDADNDGIGDNADLDDDNDGQSDVNELKCGSNPLDASSMSPDFDEDGILDCIDEDDDNDSVKDYADAFPFNETEWADYDQDGIGNNTDSDDDNDGWSDLVELTCGTNPVMVVSQPTDLDKDGIADCEDTDIDGDGVLNTEDVFPANPNEWGDNDKDGVGDHMDVDDDNDGILDTEDAFPMNSSESKDSDGDGMGDNSDPDNNNDGFDDSIIIASSLLSPNSGNIESKWVIANIEQYPRARVRVYDMHGNEVFSSLGYHNDWNGTFKDSKKKLPSGSYYYTINYHEGGKKTEGWLYLVY